jgi:hypothetical protein
MDWAIYVDTMEVASPCKGNALLSIEFASIAVQELYEMPLILFSGRGLQTSSLYYWITEALSTPRRSLKTPRKISEKDSELENLLRSAVRLLNAQKRAERIKTAGSKGNSKVR